MKKKGALLIIAVSFLFVSCVTTRVIPYETIARKPKPADFPMDIYESVNLNKIQQSTI